MKKIFVAACVLASMMIAASCGNSAPKDTTDAANKQNETKADSGAISQSADADHEFAVSAANAGMAEVKLGQLATTNGMSQKVKDFGKMMVEDHTKANNELMAIAGKENISLPAAPDSSHQKTISEMNEKKGKDFDKDYVDGMVKGHEKVEKLMQDEMKDGKDSSLKAFATKTLPVVQHHLEMIKMIQDGMKKS